MAGHPKTNTKNIKGSVLTVAFNVLKDDALSKGYIAFPGTRRESIAWGQYLGAIAALVVAGKCKVPKKEFQDPP